MSVRPLLKQQIVNVGLVLLAVVLSVALLRSGDELTTDEREARSDHLLVAFRKDEVTRLTVEGPAGHGSVVRRPGEDGSSDSWQLESPVREVADPAAVDRVLAALDHATPLRRVDPKSVGRARLGLTTPAQTLRVTQGETTHTLRLGGAAPSPAGAIYAEITGGELEPRVVVLSPALAEQLKLDPDQLRDRQVVNVSSSLLSGIVLDGSSGRRALQRDPSGTYRLETTEGDVRASRDALDMWWQAVARLRFDHFLDPPSAERARASAERWLRVELLPRSKGAPATVLELGGRCPASEHELVVRRLAPSLVSGCVAGAELARLDLPTRELVDSSLSALHVDEVESLTVAAGGRELRLTRDGKGFQLRQPAGGTVDVSAGNARVEEVLELQGRIVTGPRPAGLEADLKHGSLRLESSTFAGQDARYTEHVRFTAARHGKLYALRESDGVLLELPDAANVALSPDAALLRSTDLFQFEPKHVRALSIVSPRGEQRLERSADGQFRFVTPDGLAVDEALVTDLLATLSELRVHHWLPTSERGPWGFEAPSLELALTLDHSDGDSPLQLVVGGPAREGAFARTNQQDGVFVIERAALDRLDTLLVDRTAFLFDPAKVRRVELRGRGQTVTLEVEGDRFVQVGGPRLEPAVLLELMSTLSDLRAEAAVQLREPPPETGLSRPLLEVTLHPTAADARPTGFHVGRADVWRGLRVHYARRANGGPTYVLASSKLRPVLDALGPR